MILLEECKKLKFDHTTKPDTVLENETHKILRDFEIQKDPLIQARKSDLDKKKRKEKREENLPYNGFCCLGEPGRENQRKRKSDKYLELARELRKVVEHEDVGNTTCV